MRSGGIGAMPVVGTSGNPARSLQPVATRFRTDRPGAARPARGRLQTIGPPAFGERPGTQSRLRGISFAAAESSGCGRLRRSAMNWSNSDLSLAKRSRSRKSRNSRCSSSSRRSVSVRYSSKAWLPLERRATAAAAEALAHAAHLVFHAMHLALPALAAVTAHAPAPDNVGEDRQAHRPPEDEPEDHHDDPAGMHELPAAVAVAIASAIVSVVVGAFSGGHGSASSVNVNNIHIARERPAACQAGSPSGPFTKHVGAPSGPSRPSPRR